MNKLELMEKFMKSFVGNGFHLTIKEREGTFEVHTIEIMQKIDETCPVQEVPLGDYFLHLVATDQNGKEASIVCNWSEELLQNLLQNYTTAKDADRSDIVMFRDPVTNDPNKWVLMWGSQEKRPKSSPPMYIC